MVCSARFRFRAGRSPAMVYVWTLSLGSKHSQYTLGTLYSPLANPQSYGSAKRIGLIDSARRALGTLDYPCSEGGGTSLYIQRGKSVLYKNIRKVPNNSSGNRHEVKIDYCPGKGQKE